MLLRNISSCRFRAPSLNIAGKSTSLCDLKSTDLLQKCTSRALHQSERGLSDKIRDPKDFTRYGGRPDDPKKQSNKRWTGRSDGVGEQRSTIDRNKSQMNKVSDVKNPRMLTEDNIGHPKNPNRGYSGRPEETCEHLRKKNKEKPGAASPKKNSNSHIKPGEGLGDNKASFVGASLSNIPINTTIVNVEMSETGLSPPGAPSSNIIAKAPTSQNQMPPCLEFEGIKVDAKPREVIAVQNVSAQLGGILGQSKTDVVEPNTTGSGAVNVNNVGPSFVAASPLEPSKTAHKFGGPSIAVEIPEHVDVVTQRSSLRPASLGSQEKRSITFPVEAEQAKPLANTAESLDRQRSELKRSPSMVDVKISGTPKLKLVKETFNEKRRHRVYSFGLSETGALGLHKPNEGRRWRKFISRPLRHQFAEETRVISAESGYGFTLFYVKSENNVKLYGCGINTDFQLGPTDAEVVTYPSPIDIHINSRNTKIVSFSAGRAHSAVATDNEGVFLFGSNSYGQCGRAVDEEDKSAPACTITQIKSFGGEKAVKVNCGQDHTCFITESGKVYACGWGSEGQTGLGHTAHSSEPCLVQGDIKEENIVKVTGKCDTVLALNEKGELFGWGSNEFRQIIDDKDASQIDSPLKMDSVSKICGKIVDIAAGSSFCMVLNQEGDVYVWGYGILGGGPELDRTTVPTLLPRTLFGANEYHPKVIPLRLYCGLDHMAVMNSLNHVYSWGKNKHGCLGIGNARDQYFPYKLSVSANAVHVSCAVDHSVIVTDHI